MQGSVLLVAYERVMLVREILRTTEVERRSVDQTILFRGPNPLEYVPDVLSSTLWWNLLRTPTAQAPDRGCTCRSGSRELPSPQPRSRPVEERPDSSLLTTDSLPPPARGPARSDLSGRAPRDQSSFLAHLRSVRLLV